MSEAPSGIVPDSSAMIARHGWRSWPRPWGLLVSAIIVGATALIAHLLRGMLPVSSLPLLFLVAVLVASVRYGFWTGIATALFAFGTYDFFFVAPLYTLRVSHPEDLLALGVLFAAAAITGFLAGRLREEADAAHARAAMLEHLARFTGDLAMANDADAIRHVLVRHLAGVDRSAAVFLGSDDGKIIVKEAQPSGVVLDVHDLQAAERALRRGGEEQRTAPGWIGSDFTFRAIGGGVVGFRSGIEDSHAGIGEQFRQTILRQSELAFDRVRFADDARDAHRQAEQASLRAALLSSLSHDLKTPLATILGGVSSLRQLSGTLDAAARDDLLLAVEEEAERLSRYVVNLLHMTRLKAGIDLRRDWIDVVDVIGGAIARARRSFPDRTIAFHAKPPLPLMRGDAVLLEQALFNVIDNAARFSPFDKPVQVEVGQDESMLHVQVSDEGPGIAQSELQRIFEPFFRGEIAAAAGTVAGTGLGLAISRDIVTAMEGTIAVESPRADNAGTAIHIRLPAQTVVNTLS